MPQGAKMIRRSASAAFVVCAFACSIAGAQNFSFGPSSRGRVGPWTFDFGGQMAQPIGAFGTNVDRAWGLGGSVRHHFRGLELVGLRADAAWLNYGNENKRVPLSATVNRVLVDMRTTNNIALFTAGPELMLTRGPVRPYVYAFAGYSYFYTETSAGDDGDGGSFARSTNFDDGGWASGWGGGLRFPVALRSVEAAFDAGARLTRNGTRTYLRRGDILDQADGTLQFTPRSTPADFWQYHVGLSFAPRLR
jgi:hypothetical protein